MSPTECVPRSGTRAYCAAVTSAARTLEPEPANVPIARRFVRDLLVEWGAAAACDTVEVLVTEVATNAVLHARTPFTVEVSRDGATVRVCVLDLSPAPARMRRYGADSTTGRGLRLVASLASDWGVEPQTPGKVIWFEVPAAGDSGETVEAWEDDVDVDALLAQFDDDGDSVVALHRSAAPRDLPVAA
jgi:anti-sigma regulatory factor (Ser/Thr protein kinase)